MKNRMIIAILLSSMLYFNGCGNSSTVNQNEKHTEISGDEEQITNDVGIAKIYIKGKTDTSITIEGKIQDESGIESITLYCIDASEYYQKDKVIVVGRITKKYISSETTLKFLQHTFKDLVPGKSYLFKVVGKTEAGEVSQRITTVTKPKPKPKPKPQAVIYTLENIALGNFTSYHNTLNEYILNLTTPTQVSTVELEEYDGDLGLFDIFITDASGTEIAIGSNIVSSGNNIVKTHTFINTNTNILTTSIIIRPSNGLGGAWRLDSLIVNP